MAKKIIIVAFLLTFALAVYSFFGRETVSLRKKIAETEDPRIMLERFIYTRYHDNDVIMQASARKANFMEPNKLEIFTDVEAFRRIGNDLQELSCQLVTVHFVGQSLGDVLAKNELTRAEFDTEVKIKMSQQLVETDYAEYLAYTDTLQSHYPVTVTGKKRRFHGDSGFVYNVADDKVVLSGQVTGEMEFEN